MMYFLAIAILGAAFLWWAAGKSQEREIEAKRAAAEKERIEMAARESAEQARLAQLLAQVNHVPKVEPINPVKVEETNVEPIAVRAKKKIKNEATKLREKGDRRGAYKASMFLPPITKGYQIFLQNMGITGLGYRRQEAIAFIDDLNQTLRLEREHDNPKDENAIKVVGLGDAGEYFLGYLPKDAAVQIVKTDSFDAVYARLVRAYRGSDDYLEIQLQIIGLRTKKTEFDAFAKNLPAEESHKEYFKYWGIPFDLQLTVGDAELKIAEHSRAAQLDAVTWQEYKTYQKILDIFEDENQREYFGIKEVPRAILMATVNTMKNELGTYEEVDDDHDAIAERLIKEHPDLALID